MSQCSHGGRRVLFVGFQLCVLKDSPDLISWLEGLFNRAEENGGNKFIWKFGIQRTALQMAGLLSNSRMFRCGNTVALVKKVPLSSTTCWSVAFILSWPAGQRPWRTWPTGQLPGLSWPSGQLPGLSWPAGLHLLVLVRVVVWAALKSVVWWATMARPSDCHIGKRCQIAAIQSCFHPHSQSCTWMCHRGRYWGGGRVSEPTKRNGGKGNEISNSKKQVRT